MTDSLAEQSMVAQKIWENFENEMRRAELSHWRGVGKWSDDKKWIDVGKRSLRSLNRLLRDRKLSRDYWATKRHILEWGPGGGTNSVAFAPYAQAYYGVDISSKNLQEAQRVTESEGYSTFKPILLTGEPRQALRFIDHPVDIFLSTAVFQHFPSQSYGAEVLKVIAEVTTPGAVGSIQIRYAPSTEKYKTVENLKDYEKRFITATVYGIEQFWDLCVDSGFENIYLTDLNSNVNYVTFCLQRKI